MNSLFLAVLILSTEVFPVEDASYQNTFLTDQDLKEIADRSIQLKEKTGYTLFIDLGPADEQRQYENSPDLILTLDLQKGEGVLKANKLSKVLNESYYQQLNFLYVNKGFESNTLKESIMFMIEDIERTYADEIVLKKPVPVPVEEDEDSLSREFFNVLYFFLLVALVYVIKTIHKITRNTNKAEYWQYYGHSRMTTIQKTIVSIIMIGSIAFFIFQYVFYYDEVILLYGCLVVSSRPLILFGSHVFKLVDDKRISSKIEISKPSHLSLGQKLFLLKPNLQTEEYLLLDIYELLIKRDLIVTPELMEPAHLNRYRNFLSRNLEVSYHKVSSFQQFILDIFPADREEYYIIHPFINKVMGELMSFKHYKKDFLILDLVKQGFVSPKSWAFNTHSFTPIGEKYQRQLTQKIKGLTEKLDGYILGSTELEVAQLDGEMLLVINAEKKIDKLYEKLLNDYKLEEARQSPIGVVLEPSFSFYQYRMAIRNKITEVYESRLGNASDWSEEL